jgi:hypothetical protein
VNDVIYLKRGESPPRGKRFLLIVCVRGLRGDELIDGPKGITIRIRPESLTETISRLQRSGSSKIYVRGAPEASSG